MHNATYLLIVYYSQSDQHYLHDKIRQLNLDWCHFALCSWAILHLMAKLPRMLWMATNNNKLLHLILNQLKWIEHHSTFECAALTFRSGSNRFPFTTPNNKFNVEIVRMIKNFIFILAVRRRDQNTNNFCTLNCLVACWQMINCIDKNLFERSQISQINTFCIFHFAQ